MGSERANGISFSATPHHPSAPPSIFAPQLGHQFRFQSSSFLKTQAHWLHRNPALKVLLVPNPCSSTSTQSHSSHRPFRTGSTSAAGASRTIFSTQVITQSRHQSPSRSQPVLLAWGAIPFRHPVYERFPDYVIIHCCPPQSIRSGHYNHPYRIAGSTSPVPNRKPPRRIARNYSYRWCRLQP